MDFYNRLNYSLGNEDWSTEEQALRIKSDDCALCVTASGDRPLHLLMTDCAEVIAIDMNIIQNHLLELKLAAITHLDYHAYLEFLGCSPSRYRFSTFKYLTAYLSKEAAEFWKKNKKMLDRGIIYQGRVERLTYYLSILFNLLKGKKISTLFSFNDIESQREFVLSQWNTPLLRKIFDIGFNPNVVKAAINDPGIISYIDSSIKPGAYIYQRMIEYLTNHLAKKSALLQLVFTGRITPDAYFPYMTLDGYYKIRKNAHKLKLYTVNVIEYINQENPETFDCFSMSDVASYMPQESFNQLLNGIYHAAKPQARFCLRKLMCSHTIPDQLSDRFLRDFNLEKKLEQEESNFVYRFLTGEIKK